MDKLVATYIESTVKLGSLDLLDIVLCDSSFVAIFSVDRVFADEPKLDIIKQ